MKSRISFFNKTVFKKNLTRFAPAWGLYTICLMMGLFLMADTSSMKWLAADMGECAQLMCVVTPCYALLVAQLLFGDLFNARMCNALHALPMRRETWFMTNLASAMVFHLIPTAVMCAASTFLIGIAGYGGWEMGPGWMLAVNLQYLCFFGIAVFSVFCVGSRFAQVMVYGILNFASLIAGWLVDTLYTPMFYGVQTNTEPFYWCSPFARMIREPFLYIERVYDEHWSNPAPGEMILGENFWYYFICAAVGIGLMALALQMYRKRKLECAGDFMAIKAMEPVFQVVYTLCVCAVFHFIYDEMFGVYGYVFLLVGLAVGWFTGRMLLERTVRVFRWRSFAGCGILAAVFGLTLVVASLDPFGIESWVPDAEEVEYVVVAEDHYIARDCEITLEDAADIETVIGIHQAALEGHIEDLMAVPATAEMAEVVTTPATVDEVIKIAAENGVSDFTFPFQLEYHMTDGRVVNRYYYLWNYSESGQILQEWFSSPEAVFGVEATVEELMKINPVVTVEGSSNEEEPQLSGEELRGLLEAMMKDCEAGTMIQDWDFHQDDTVVCYVSFRELNKTIYIYNVCENTIAYLRECGFELEK